MVKDLYSPYIYTPNFGERFSDSLFGTNYSNFYNTLNNYNLQKAINVNKYEWNKYGMVQAGINPLIASSNLGNVSTSQSQSNMSSNLGMVGEVLKTIVKVLPLLLI